MIHPQNQYAPQAFAISVLSYHNCSEKLENMWLNWIREKKTNKAVRLNKWKLNIETKYKYKK